MKKSKLNSFPYNGQAYLVRFIETQKITKGVACDIYAFTEDETKDLAIITIDRGNKTPLQKLIGGNVTIEGFVSGSGILRVKSKDEEYTYIFNQNSSDPVSIKQGEIIQWIVDKDSDLVVFEICEPPFSEGRFENLKS